MKSVREQNKKHNLRIAPFNNIKFCSYIILFFIFIWLFILLIDYLPDSDADAASTHNRLKHRRTVNKRDDGGYSLRVYDFYNGRSRICTSFAIINRDLEETRRLYGVSDVELRQYLNLSLNRFAAQHRGEISVRSSKDGKKYQYQVSNGKRYLVAELNRFLIQERMNYFKSRCMAIYDGKLRIDYPAVQRWQAPYIKPLYLSLKKEAHNRSFNERDFIILLTRFAQSLSYVIPPVEENGKRIGGLWPPLLCLWNKAGDCDTKSLLFATLYSHYRTNGCILIITDRHAFIGIRNQHRVFPCDRVATIRGEEYMLQEMTSYQNIGVISEADWEHVRKGRFRYISFH